MARDMGWRRRRLQANRVMLIAIIMLRLMNEQSDGAEGGDGADVQREFSF